VQVRRFVRRPCIHAPSCFRFQHSRGLGRAWVYNPRVLAEARGVTKIQACEKPQ
jgi:hypothetical protein